MSLHLGDDKGMGWNDQMRDLITIDQVHIRPERIKGMGWDDSEMRGHEQLVKVTYRRRQIKEMGLG